MYLSLRFVSACYIMAARADVLESMQPYCHLIIWWSFASHLWCLSELGMLSFLHVAVSAYWSHRLRICHIVLNAEGTPGNAEVSVYCNDACADGHVIFILFLIRYRGSTSLSQVMHIFGVSFACFVPRHAAPVNILVCGWFLKLICSLHSR